MVNCIICDEVIDTAPWTYVSSYARIEPLCNKCFQLHADHKWNELTKILKRKENK